MAILADKEMGKLFQKTAKSVAFSRNSCHKVHNCNWVRLGIERPYGSTGVMTLLSLRDFNDDGRFNTFTTCWHLELPVVRS